MSLQAHSLFRYISTKVVPSCWIAPH